jgi:hypothetical protein
MVGTLSGGSVVVHPGPSRDFTASHLAPNNSHVTCKPPFDATLQIDASATIILGNPYAALPDRWGDTPDGCSGALRCPTVVPAERPPRCRDGELQVSLRDD